MSIVPPEFQYLHPGTEVDLTNCDREPIHLVGKIQSGTCLMALRCPRENPDTWQVIALSSNFEELAGEAPDLHGNTSPRAILGEPIQKAVTEVLPLPESASRHLEKARVGKRELDVSVYRLEGYVILEMQEPSLAFEELVLPFLKESATLDGLEGIGQIATDTIKRGIGCDQVILYRFDDTYHGEAIAESREEHLPGYLGRWFPEGDVPLPARIVMTKRPVGVCISHHDEGIGLIPGAGQNTEIDLSYCVYRTQSKMCSMFYQNLGINGTMVAAILRNGRLWGFFSCWFYERNAHISMRQRLEFEKLSVVFMREFEARYAQANQAAIYELRSKHDAFLNNLQKSKGIVEMLGSIEVLVNLLPAQGAILALPGNYSESGQTPPVAFVEKLIAWLDEHHGQVPVFHHRNLESVFPEAGDYRDRACGILALRLGRRSSSYMIWLRGEIAQEFEWAGKPEKREDHFDPGRRLLPRTAFSIWRELAQGYSAPWQFHELELAEGFRNELLLILNDYSNQELSRLLKLANEAKRARELMLANVSHELRTPINGILANAEILARERADDESHEIATDIVASTNHLRRLLNDLLDLARIDSGQITIHPSSVRLASLESALRSTLKKPLAQKSQEIDFDWGEWSETSIWIDKDRLMQILVNLLDNAIKYSQERTRIRLIARLVDDGPGCLLNLEIVDQGVGIPPERRTDLLDAFTRISTDQPELAPGLGLGLSIVNGIVSFMAGELRIVDNPEGQGTSFQIRIPTRVSQPDSESDAHGKDGGRNFPDLSAYRILVADDDPISSKVIERIGERAGLRADFVTSGLDAVAAAMKADYDLYLFDLRMPGMDGDAAIRKIRASETKAASVPGIAVTAHGFQAERQSILSAGFQAVCFKPYSIDDLLQTIRTTIEKGSGAKR